MQVNQPLSLKIESIGLGAFSDCRQSFSTLDLNQHCRGFLDLIVDYLSLPSAWILRRDLGNQLKIEMEKDGSQQPGVLTASHNRTSLNALPSPSNLCSQLVLESATGFEKPGLQHWVYQDWQVYSSCLCRQQGQYLLFASRSPLTMPEQHWVDRQILLISDYFDLHLAFSQQQAALLAKQQHLHQTTHQLGTPLSLITLYADMLRFKTPPESGQDYLVPLQQAVKQLHHHLQELVDDEAEDSPIIEQCNLRELVAENIQALQPRLQSQEIEIHCPQTSEVIGIDRWQMLQVFDNLLSNALHFSPRGSQITLTWQRFQTEILIEVRDQGPGLSPEDLCCMFSPYYSRRDGGRGLGLAIAQQIVCRHRGRLWASNLPESGAQFSISLPQESKN